MNFVDQIVVHVDAGCQAFYVSTKETVRCEMALQTVATRIAKKKRDTFTIWTWDCINGINELEDGNKFKDPQAALRKIPELPTDGLVVFKNVHQFLSRSPEARQAFKNLREKGLLNNRKAARPIVFLSNAYEIHPEIRHDLTEIEFILPTLDEHYATVDALAASANTTIEPALRERLARALLGLTSVEATEVVYYAAVAAGGIKSETVDIVENEKAKTIKADGVLTYIPKENLASKDEIGDYDELMTFIEQRKLAYTKEAVEIDLDTPRGLVLLGAPGSGKSVTGKTIAKMMGLPLVIFDVSSVYGSLVGASEASTRSALAQVRALNGSVLLCDESDKLFQGSGDTSGVSQRVLGIYLTWLTERPKNDRTFVIMTMNRTDGIPPELLRAGRFDKIFYAGIPDDDGRWDIFKIHCRKRGIDPDKFSAKEKTDFLKATHDFVGSELEEVVKGSRFLSFSARRSGVPTMEEIVTEAGKITPVIKLAGNENLKTRPDFAYPVSKRRAKGGHSTRSLDLGLIVK